MDTKAKGTFDENLNTLRAALIIQSCGVPVADLSPDTALGSLHAALEQHFKVSHSDAESHVRLVLRCLKLLHQCKYTQGDIEVILAHSTSYMKDLMGSLAKAKSMGLTECVHVVLLWVYIAHTIVQDTTCSLDQWHRLIFRTYCDLRTLDGALMGLLKHIQYRLRLPRAKLKNRLSLFQGLAGAEVDDEMFVPLVWTLLEDQLQAKRAMGNSFDLSEGQLQAICRNLELPDTGSRYDALVSLGQLVKEEEDATKVMFTNADGDVIELRWEPNKTPAFATWRHEGVISEFVNNELKVVDVNNHTSGHSVSFEIDLEKREYKDPLGGGVIRPKENLKELMRRWEVLCSAVNRQKRLPSSFTKPSPSVSKYGRSAESEALDLFQVHFDEFYMCGTASEPPSSLPSAPKPTQDAGLKSDQQQDPPVQGSFAKTDMKLKSGAGSNASGSSGSGAVPPTSAVACSAPPAAAAHVPLPASKGSDSVPDSQPASSAAAAHVPLPASKGSDSVPASHPASSAAAPAASPIGSSPAPPRDPPPLGSKSLPNSSSSSKNTKTVVRNTKNSVAAGQVAAASAATPKLEVAGEKSDKDEEDRKKEAESELPTKHG